MTAGRDPSQSERNPQRRMNLEKRKRVRAGISGAVSTEIPRNIRTPCTTVRLRDSQGFCRIVAEWLFVEGLMNELDSVDLRDHSRGGVPAMGEEQLGLSEFEKYQDVHVLPEVREGLRGLWMTAWRMAYAAGAASAASPAVPGSAELDADTAACAMRRVNEINKPGNPKRGCLTRKEEQPRNGTRTRS